MVASPPMVQAPVAISVELVMGVEPAPAGAKESEQPARKIAVAGRIQTSRRTGLLLGFAGLVGWVCGRMGRL